LTKVIFANTQFVAVGYAGAILTSPDGYAWTSRVSGTTNALYSVAYGNGEYIACGANGQLTISTNGLVWSPASVGSTDLNWITFGNGVFVTAAPNVADNQMAVRVSPDGQIWTTESFPAGTAHLYPSILYEATFANGLFVASANVESVQGINIYSSRIQFFTSTNGRLWLPGAITEDAYNPSFFTHRFFTYANGIFYEFTGRLNPPYESANRVPYTVDGTTLGTALAPDEAFDSTSMVYGNGRYLLTALNGKLWTSSNGTNWTPQYSGFRNTVNRIIRGRDRYLAAANGAILTSLDGVSFGVLPGIPALNYSDIAFDGSNYVAIAAAGYLYSSTDGINWTQRTSNTSNDLLAITRGPNRWVAAGLNGTVTTSPNTLSWTLRPSGTDNALRGAAYGNGLYATVGNGGTIITSADGATWDVQFSQTLSELYGISYLNGRFVAVGANGTILTSTDAASWQAQTSPVSCTLKSVAFGDGRFVACGFEHSVLLQSSNGTDWQDITTKVPAYVGLNSISFLEGSFFLCGNTGAILQSDSVDHLPHLSGVMRSEGFQIKLVQNAPPGYRIQACTNIASQSWQDLVTITNPASPFVWIDSNALAFPIRFYRAVGP